MWFPFLRVHGEYYVIFILFFYLFYFYFFCSTDLSSTNFLIAWRDSSVFPNLARTSCTTSGSLNPSCTFDAYPLSGLMPCWWFEILDAVVCIRLQSLLQCELRNRKAATCNLKWIPIHFIPCQGWINQEPVSILYIYQICVDKWLKSYASLHQVGIGFQATKWWEWALHHDAVTRLMGIMSRNEFTVCLLML